MINLTFRKLLILLTTEIKIKLFFLLISTVLMSFLEIIGIGMLASFILFLSDMDKFLLMLADFKIIQQILSLSDNEKILIFLILIIIIFLFKNIITFIYNIYLNKTRIFLHLFIVKNILSKYFNSNYSFFFKKKISIIINEIKEETTRFTGVVISYVNIFKEIFLMFVIIMGVISVNWKITLGVFFTILIVTSAVFRILKKRLIKLGESQTIYSTKLFKILNETFTGIKFIKIKFLESFFFNKIYKTYSSSLNVNFYQSIFVIIPRLLLEILAVVGLCLSIYFFILLNYTFNQIIPLITFLSLVIIRTVPAVAALNQNINNITSNSVSVDIISNLISDLNLNNNNLLNIKNNDKIYEDIQEYKLENICYKYDSNSKNSLEQISFKIEKNDILGVIGKSGSGKTTLINIILGLLKPISGTRIINNKIVEDFSQYNLSYVPQDISILDENLISNIAFGIEQKNINLDEVNNLINATQLDKNLLGGNKTLGESGLNISGGQKQRIGFARGLYGSCSLIAFDEPTSELDYETQEIIIKYIKTLSKSKITILIAHRLDTLKICNKIIILENGKILDFGSRDEIIKRNPYLQKYLEN